jgi:hypothetical protein
MPFFAEYETERGRWITVFGGEPYPEGLTAAVEYYGPYCEAFGELLEAATDSCDLLRLVHRETGARHAQIRRVFRRYVAPGLPVELLKQKGRVEEVIRDFGAQFRPIGEVRAAFRGRPRPDETLAALLYEHKDRGSRGYDLTTLFFGWFDRVFAHDFSASGPKGAGKDILLGDVLPGYEAETPADVVICDIQASDRPVVAVCFAHYDSDRGGSQEDRGPAACTAWARSVLDYASRTGRSLKVLFLNDGPGLLTGSMWRDHGALEQIDPRRVMVCTLKMLRERLTAHWLRSA